MKHRRRQSQTRCSPSLQVEVEYCLSLGLLLEELMRLLSKPHGIEEERQIEM